MTVMIDSFFGVHPHVVRSGTWGSMKHGEKNLYIFLMEESERCCTRRLVVTDAQVSQSVNVASRTLCDARKKLQERGLISFKAVVGNRYEYTICDPKTGKAYAGDPRMPIVVPKRGRSQTPAFFQAASGRVASQQYSPPKTDDNDSLEKHGVALQFRKGSERERRRPGCEMASRANSKR